MIDFDHEPPSGQSTGSSEQRSAKNQLVDMLNDAQHQPYHSRDLRDTFDSEEDLLEYELTYRPPRHDTRFFKTHPAGYNVVTAMGAFAALGGWTLTVMISLLFVESAGLTSIFIFCIAVVVGLSLGFTIPEMIWRGIGPHGREAMRPLGWFGTLPMLFVCFCCFAVVAGVIRAVVPQKPPSAQNPTPAPAKAAPRAPVVWKGNNWTVILDSKGKPIEPTRQKALAACAALGPGWRLPTASDAVFLTKNLSESHWSSMF